MWQEYRDYLLVNSRPSRRGVSRNFNTYHYSIKISNVAPPAGA